MDILQVDAKSKNYPIYVDNSFDNLAYAFENAGLTRRKAIIVTDSNVSPLYLNSVKEILSRHFPILDELVFEAGEKSKSLDTIQSMYQKFIKLKLDRKSVVIALGGGVCGDMAGFAAATYMRGVSYVQIPTTLLSQVDSSVGGKTGVDFNGFKNIIGAFYQPEFVYINVSVLKTLPYDQFISGMSEVIKHGIIKDREYFDFIVSNAENIIALEEATLVKMITGSCKIKADIVSQDEKESGLREILNFGHTFGHAVETYLNFSLPHGQCVALGMIAAINFSKRQNRISEPQSQQCFEAFTKLGFPTKIGVDINHGDTAAEDIYSLMAMDKKVRGNKITVIVADEIGNVHQESIATKQEIIAAIKTIF